MKDGRVLEIGSRVIHTSRRGLFSGDYVGFDYHDGNNVDVVGDAHRLEDYFERESFDGVLSCSVMEHLAMPWVVAQQINKVLKVGGYTYQHVPLNWPVHELPWDFWRFTAEGLKVLFSEQMGFEIISWSYSAPTSTYLNSAPSDPNSTAAWLHRVHPHGMSFGSASILARKVGDYIPWEEIDLHALTLGTQYPKRKGT